MDAAASPAVDLANTVHAVRGRVRDGMEAWLEQRGRTAERDRLTELRDAVRTLIEAAATGGHYAPEAVAVVNRASAAAPSWSELTDGPAIAERTDPATSAADAEMATIARDAIALLGSERREALRACQAPGCVQFFVKAHARQEFCGPVCSNRARAARHYARHKGA
ncbi:ABATE domain-containing protein [Kitasatospora sp. NPDC094028]